MTPTRSAKARPVPAGIPRQLSLVSSALACVGNDTKLNEFSADGTALLALPDRRPSRPIANCTTGSSRSRAAGQRPKPDRPGLHFGHQRRVLLRRPLPAALNHDLAIHSKQSFWPVQKGPASLSTPLSTTADRPV
jgi:hypothetical protein